MASSSTTIGRPKKSPVWDYFSYNVATGKSICAVVTNKKTNAMCGKIISGKYSTNLKFHLKAMHREMYEDVLKKKRMLKRRNSRKKKRGQLLLLVITQINPELPHYYKSLRHMTKMI